MIQGSYFICLVRNRC